MSYAARANRYARAVVAGRVNAGLTVRQACKRHLDDIGRSRQVGYSFEFNPGRANLICEFAERMVHVKGDWAKARQDGGLPLIRLEDWQCFILGVTFGWIDRKTKRRRIREIYAEIPRKNSKSTLGAIIGLYLAFADDEAGAEVFAGATSMDQAYAVFRMAWLMVRNNPEFQAHFGLQLGGTEQNPGNIYQMSTGSYFKPIIGKPGDGDSPHGAIIDEYHEHTTPVMYDAMKTGMGARSQPLRAIITTAGTDTSGPCYDKHLEAIKVLNGTLENDELFTLVFALDEDDDWKDFAMWKKANPNFGVSVFESYFRGQLRDALQSPSQQSIILTKNLNRWMSAGSAWMNMVSWEKCKDETMHLEGFANKECWLGLDLANKIDIASLAFIFKMPWGIAFFAKHYLPEATVALPQNSHYRKWAEAGWLTQTDGARTDFRRIESDIRDACKMFSIQSLAFDPREASYLISSIQDWASFDCVEINQGPQLISEPMKEMEAAIYAGQLKHCGDPVLTWMMGNVVKKESRAGGAVKYYYPTKDRDANKIDGIVAGIMALSRAMVHQSHVSPYDTPGFTSVMV